MSDSDFTAHETEEFTEDGDCQNGVDCITQPLEPKDFVLLKFSKKNLKFSKKFSKIKKKKSVQYLVQLIKKWDRMVSTPYFLGSDSRFRHFFVPKVEECSNRSH